MATELVRIPPVERSQRPFVETVQSILDDQEVSQRELSRRCEARGWGAKATIHYLVTGKIGPTMNSMERIASALGVKPEVFAEYRLAVARESLDPEVVGLRQALRNLGE